MPAWPLAVLIHTRSTIYIQHDTHSSPEFDCTHARIYFAIRALVLPVDSNPALWVCFHFIYSTLPVCPASGVRFKLSRVELETDTREERAGLRHPSRTCVVQETFQQKRPSISLHPGHAYIHTTTPGYGCFDKITALHLGGPFTPDKPSI